MLGHEGLGAVCGACRGLWLAEAKLDEMVREMHDGLGALAFTPRPLDRVAPCPTCGQALDGVTLRDVRVERCARGHGVWFDIHELQIALHNVGKAEPSPPPPTVLTGVPDIKIGFWDAVVALFDTIDRKRR